MLKKFVFAAGIASLALSPALAAPETEIDPAAEAAAAADEIAGMSAEDAALVKALNPFAGLEAFALKKPLVELSVPDAARLAVADKVMGKLMANGTYAHVMSTMQKDTLQPLLDRLWTMKASELIDLFGFPKDDMPKDKADETFADAMMKNDPHGKERIEAYMTTYFDLLGDMVGAIEPDVRGAMARDFARKYDLAQLTEMDRFFSSPAGAAFAKDYMTSSFTLDVLQTSLMVWPKMVKQVPDFAQRLLKADAHLPPAPKSSPVTVADDLTPACAKDGDSSDCTEEDWEAAYTDKSETERAAWSKKDRSIVEKAEAKRDKAQDAINAQYTKLYAAEDEVSAAISKARENAGQEAAPLPPPIMVVPNPVPVMAPPASTPQE